MRSCCHGCGGMTATRADSPPCRVHVHVRALMTPSLSLVMIDMTNGCHSPKPAAGGMLQPHEMCALMNFTAEERAELQFPELVELAEQERAAIEGLHAAIFSSSSGELAALDLAPHSSDTVWAASLVNSRCFSDNVRPHCHSICSIAGSTTRCMMHHCACNSA